MAGTESETRSFISWPQAAFIGVAAMVGAGIFSLLGAAGEVAGTAVWLSFALAGIIAGIQGYSFAKLGARYPVGGRAAGIRPAGLRRRPLHRHRGMDDVLGEHHRHRDGGRLLRQLRQRHVRQRERGVGQSVAALIVLIMMGVNVIGSRLLPARRA